MHGVQKASKGHNRQFQNRDYLKKVAFPKKGTNVRSTACVLVAPRVSNDTVIGTDIKKRIKDSISFKTTKSYWSTWHSFENHQWFFKLGFTTNQKQFHHFPYIASSCTDVNSVALSVITNAFHTSKLSLSFLFSFLSLSLYRVFSFIFSSFYFRLFQILSVFLGKLI